jgi:hypothetical protein
VEEAQAKRIPKLYTFGPATSEMGTISKEVLDGLPPEQRAELEKLGADRVGFFYQHFGLFWLDIWSWSGKYTVYNHVKEQHYEISDADAAALLGIDEKKLSKPLSYHIPWGTVLILGLLAIRIVPRLIAKRRYQRQMTQQPAIPAWSPPPVAPPEQAPPPPPVGYGPPPPARPPVPPPLPPDQQ